MLGTNEFHHDLIAKYCKVFGSMFTDIEIYRGNNNGQPSLQKVPLMWSAKDKIHEFAKQEYLSSKAAVATISPRIGYDLVNVQRDSSRKTGKFNLITMDNGTTRNFMPYNFIFEVNIVGKTETDCQRVVEQIIPHFDPSLTVTIFPFPDDHSYSRDIIIELAQTSKTDTYQGEAENRRVVTWTMEFVLKGFLFGPVKDNHGKVIKKIILSYNDAESTEIFPGLTSDGEPTTDPEQAVDYKTVDASDPYAIIEVNY